MFCENKCPVNECKEIWVRFGAGEKNMGIPIHVLANKLGDHLSSLIILKTHLVTGCDVASKIRTKPSTMKNSPEIFLEDFENWRTIRCCFQKCRILFRKCHSTKFKL